MKRKKAPPPLDWATANQRYLVMATEVVQAHLAVKFADAKPDRLTRAKKKLAGAADDLPHPAALDSLCSWFGLSEFERNVIALCASVELDGTAAQFLANLPPAQGASRVTFSLALAALPDAHWSALSPQAPLRSWKLVSVEGESLVHSPLRIDERVLHFLTGTPALNRHAADLVERVATGGALPPSHSQIAERLAGSWANAGDTWPVLQLCGADGSSHRAIAAAACARLGLALHAVDARDLPSAPAERQGWFRLWEREAILSHTALLLDAFDAAPPDLAATVRRMPGPLFISVREALALAPRASLREDIPPPAPNEQKDMWTAALGKAAAAFNGEIEAVVAQFDLPAASIESAAHLARADLARRKKTRRGGIRTSQPLWRLAQAQVDTRLGELAQRISPRAEWDRLVLPKAQKDVLRTILAQVRQRRKVYEEWGLADASQSGLGLSTLFSGPSGTGKTMAAEVLARELQLDLYRIDLSAVVSKYIGETEKNLRRVFDAADSGGAVLLFDEADALFGRRSEVKDSHDRYANIEVSYLLQRMEAYRGLAILTTNQKEALDAAFVRRLRFIVQFPFPDSTQRAEIWSKTFTKKTPTKDLDFEKLARLNVTGGSIRNIALNAAFLAADDEPLQMRHLHAAAATEANKLERPLMETEVAGWI